MILKFAIPSRPVDVHRRLWETCYLRNVRIHFEVCPT